MPNAPTEIQGPDLLHDYATAVGYLVIYWAALENALTLCLQKLTCADELTTDCIATSIGRAEARAELIHRLAMRPSPSDEWRDCVIGICEQIVSMAAARNRLVHDDWHHRDDVITRQNNALKLRKPGAGEAKALLKNSPIPSHAHEILALTDKTVHIMLHLPFLCAAYERWKLKGMPVTVPQQAIQLSKGILPDSFQLDDPALPPPPQS